MSTLVSYKISSGSWGYCEYQATWCSLHTEYSFIIPWFWKHCFPLCLNRNSSLTDSFPCFRSLSSKKYPIVFQITQLFTVFLIHLRRHHAIIYFLSYPQNSKILNVRTLIDYYISSILDIIFMNICWINEHFMNIN